MRIKDSLLALGYPSFTLEDFHDTVSISSFLIPQFAVTISVQKSDFIGHLFPTYRHISLCIQVIPVQNVLASPEIDWCLDANENLSFTPTSLDVMGMNHCQSLCCCKQ